MISDVFNIKFDITCILFQNIILASVLNHLGRLNELEVHHRSVYGASPCQCPVLITPGDRNLYQPVFLLFSSFSPKSSCILYFLISCFIFWKYLSVAFIHRSQCGWILHWIWTPLPSFKEFHLPLFLAVEALEKSEVSLALAPLIPFPTWMSLGPFLRIKVQ